MVAINHSQQLSSSSAAGGDYTVCDDSQQDGVLASHAEYSPDSYSKQLPAVFGDSVHPGTTQAKLLAESPNVRLTSRLSGLTRSKLRVKFAAIILATAFVACNLYMSRPSPVASSDSSLQEDSMDSTRGSSRCAPPYAPPDVSEYADSALTGPNCYCREPSESASFEDYQLWIDFHNNRTADILAQTTSPRLVMYGDSITERLGGTVDLGTPPNSDKELQLNMAIKHVWESHFADWGMPIAASADTTNNLLHHLQHGWLPDSLQPTHVILLIGTNNLGIERCSKQVVLAGILEVGEYIMRERPGVHIILHGLLPRLNSYPTSDMMLTIKCDASDADGGEGESGDSGSYEVVGQLGRMWDDIEWINAEMREVAHSKANAGWHYVDARSVFVKRVQRARLPAGARESTNGVVVEGVHVSAKTGAGMSRQAQSESDIGSGADADEMVDVIDLRLMPDGLHPNVEGYELWLGKLSREVGEIMRKGG
jgi:lysophospholipase L1-like esterase